MISWLIRFTIIWMILASTTWKNCISISTANIFTGLTLTTHEGDTVFIPCGVPLESSLNIVWAINGVLYSVDSLQSRNLEPLSSGLLIKNVSFSHNAGKYVCYESSNTFQQLNVVHLSVLSSKVERNSSFVKDTNVEDVNIYKGLNFKVTENDFVFLPCIPALGTSSITIWGIDGALYLSSKLPKWHIHHLGGILLGPVTLGITGQMYKCYKPVENTIDVQYSIYLSIRPLSIQPITPNEFITSGLQQFAVFGGISLVSKKVSFNDTHKNFGFKLATQSFSESWETLFITEVIQQNEPGAIFWDDSSFDFEPIFSIPSKHFNSSQTYATTFAKNETSGQNEPTATLSFLYRTNENEINDEHCIPEGETQCVYLPTSKHSLSVIWPKQPHSDEDCSCPVFEERDDGPKFKNCYCFHENPPTTYDVELRDNNRVCFMSLNRSSNDTKVLIARDTALTFETFRTVESLTRITVQGPFIPPPNLVYHNDTIVCSISNSTKWSPIIGTYVVANDTTGGIIIDRVFHENFCLDLSLLPPSCAPFHVSMSAVSQCAVSEPSSFQGIGNGNECDCINEKVMVITQNINATSDEILVTINSSCSEEYQTHIIKNISLTATAVSNNVSSGNNASTYFTILCEQTETYNLTIRGVTPSTQYRVTAEWVSLNTGRHCPIGGNQFIETAAAESNLEIIIVASIIGGIMLFVLIILSLLLIVCCRVKMTEREINFEKMLDKRRVQTSTE